MSSKSKKHVRVPKTEIVLEFPFERGGALVSKLEIRRPKVRDLIDAKGKDDREKEVALFANLTMCTPDEIGQLDLVDYKALQEAYEDFSS